MSTVKKQFNTGRSGERGSVIIMTAISMLFLLLLVGLCIDVSRIYMVRAELQNAADAAALTAARELNGYSGGVNDAVVKANAIVNTRGFAKVGVEIDSVQFAVSLDGTYMNADAADDPGTVENIRYVRVTTQAATTNILFAVKALGTSHTESRQAVAGKSVEIDGICDFFPAAISLNDYDDDDTTGFQGFTPPPVGTLLTLNFNQGTGNEAVIAHGDYIILEVRDFNGNSVIETAQLTAGLRNYCKSLGDNINMTPSSNSNNGPRNAGDGLNTRFGIYANGYANQLNAGNFPPDTNVSPDISVSQYFNGPPAEGNERRVLIAPIILPGTYPAYTTNIKHWGKFLLKRPSPTPNGNCSTIPGCGSLPVEYFGEANVSSFGDPSCNSGLTTPVLYR